MLLLLVLVLVLVLVRWMGGWVSGGGVHDLLRLQWTFVKPRMQEYFLCLPSTKYIAANTNKQTRRKGRSSNEVHKIPYAAFFSNDWNTHQYLCVSVFLLL
jgi:hypothetical protein